MVADAIVVVCTWIATYQTTRLSTEDAKERSFARILLVDGECRHIRNWAMNVLIIRVLGSAYFAYVASRRALSAYSAFTVSPGSYSS